MEVNKDVLDTLIKNLEESLRELQRHVSFYIGKMKEVESVEKVMEYKRELLIRWLTDMPLSSCECYFCIFHGDHCDECEYREYHGTCGWSSDVDIIDELERLIGKYSGKIDDWTLINALRKALVNVIREVYYKGEIYEAGQSNAP